ncbi:unnamed protein product [Adineta steineri]|uniref:Uncharacterized protein n=1 Tax=Adineta steineri TaxID=433720 RepID=A0A814IB84_9BILA|nr:unnamed protein product [Adineta steineri]CAF4003022.1 unnamed protein product [Adineta steineri]
MNINLDNRGHGGSRPDAGRKQQQTAASIAKLTQWIDELKWPHQSIQSSYRNNPTALLVIFSIMLEDVDLTQTETHSNRTTPFHKISSKAGRNYTTISPLESVIIILFLSCMYFDMDLNNIGMNTNSDSSRTTSTEPSTSVTPSTRSRVNYSSTSNDSLITNDTRQSSRLSNKSPKNTALTNTDLNIHRTILGGVVNNSPKLNSRRRTSCNNNHRDASASSISFSTTTVNDNSVDFDDNNTNETYDKHLLPSDQSEDDEMLVDNNELVKRKSSGLASRNEVLSYFWPQDNGYKCKLCSNVSFIF